MSFATDLQTQPAAARRSRRTRDQIHNHPSTMKYRIETNLYGGHWQDAGWTEDDKPLRFDTIGEANAAIVEHLENLSADFEETSANYRVAPVADNAPHHQLYDVVDPHPGQFTTVEIQTVGITPDDGDGESAEVITTEEEARRHVAEGHRIVYGIYGRLADDDGPGEAEHIADRETLADAEELVALLFGTATLLRQ